MPEFSLFSSTAATALAGGALIGLAAVLLLWFNGRIAGISGILSQASRFSGQPWPWLFLLGLIAGAGIFMALAAGLGQEIPQPRTGMPGWLLALAGVLVGYGTALGSGCTSGHGVCGLARLSVRSLVAVAIFLATALLTTWIVRHLLGVVL